MKIAVTQSHSAFAFKIVDSAGVHNTTRIGLQELMSSAVFVLNASLLKAISIQLWFSQFIRVSISAQTQLDLQESNHSQTNGGSLVVRILVNFT